MSTHLPNSTADNGSGSGIMLASKPIIGWKNASMQLGASWHVYRYSVISINTALIIWCLVNIFLIFRGKSIFCRQYFLSLNFLVLFYGITRILCYAIDPMSINGYMPKLAGNLLTNTNFPIVAVGSFLLYVALRQCTIPNPRLLPLILKPSLIGLFTFICFTLSLCTDVLVASFSYELMIIVCQGFYALLGFVFFWLYSILIFRYKASVRRSKRKMEKSCYIRGHCRRDFSSRNLTAIPRCMKIAYVCAFLFLAISFFNIYLILAEIGMLKRSVLRVMCDKYREVRPFFIFHVSFVATETMMVIMLAIAGTQPLKSLRLKKLAPLSRTITSTPTDMLTATTSFSADNLAASVFTIEQHEAADSNEGISSLSTNNISNSDTPDAQSNTSTNHLTGLSYIQDEIYRNFPS